MNRLVKLPLLALTAALAGYTLPAGAQDFTIVNARLAIGDGSEPIDNGVVEIRGGKVVSAGPAAGPAVRTGTVLDAEGAWVTPGIFAAITDLGLVDVGGVDESNDTRASDSPFNIALDVSTSINPAAQDIGVSRAGGVTRASITP
ncbi:MAG: amidohydrolase, partial [Allopontixanthobacter sediminis]